MPAPIFNFRNVKMRVPDGNPLTLYTVATFSNASPMSTLPLGVDPTEVSIVLLTVQCANISGNPSQTTTPRKTINLSVWVENNSIRNYLVNDYTVIPNNAFDPLNGNLIMSAGDSLRVQVSNPSSETANQSVVNCVDVTVSLLEIANATAV
jgi:hypothetical protein